VIAGTAAGLAGLLAFHTSPVKVTLAPLPTTPTAGRGTATQPTAGRGTATQAPSGTRSAVGATVNYYFGTMAVSVTATGSHVTNVTVASLNDGGNYRSQSIDQAAVPILEHQAEVAQSAHIQGVSGASYTSAGFAQSLQSALSKLGL
jgi:uncharacterized protein with FMN-binding domain